MEKNVKKTFCIFILIESVFGRCLFHVVSSSLSTGSEGSSGWVMRRNAGQNSSVCWPGIWRQSWRQHEVLDKDLRWWKEDTALRFCSDTSVRGASGRERRQRLCFCSSFNERRAVRWWQSRVCLCHMLCSLGYCTSRNDPQKSNEMGCRKQAFSPGGPYDYYSRICQYSKSIQRTKSLFSKIFFILIKFFLIYLSHLLFTCCSHWAARPVHVVLPMVHDPDVCFSWNIFKAAWTSSSALKCIRNVDVYCGEFLDRTEKVPALSQGSLSLKPGLFWSWKQHRNFLCPAV